MTLQHADERPVLIDASSPTVTTVTINRPKKLNALNRAVATGIAEAIADLEVDDARRVGVVTGAGGVFSAGFDLSTFRSDDHPDEPTLPADYLSFIANGAKKPLVAGVEGYALGGGLELALTCDVIVASRTASFGLPEVKRGLLAGGGGLLRLADRIARNEAMAIAILGDSISAERAFDLGLVHQLVPDGEVRECAIDLAHRIAQNAPLAVAASRRVIVESRDWSRADAWERQADIADELLATDDAREGALAFAEKRHPVWKGL